MSCASSSARRRRFARLAAAAVAAAATSALAAGDAAAYRSPIPYGFTVPRPNGMPQQCQRRVVVEYGVGVNDRPGTPVREIITSYVEAR